MKTCPVCGLDVEDSYLYCPDDGSKLVDAPPPGESLAPAAGAPPKVAQPTAPSDVVVLYCGECAAEYPMTFVECPVHHVLLTRHKIQPIAAVLAAEAGPAESNHQEQSSIEKSDQEYQTPVEQAGYLAAPQYPKSFDTGRDEREASPAPALPAPYPLLSRFGTKRGFRSSPTSILSFDDPREEHDSGQPASASVSRYDSPSFRLVAATMVMGLVIFCIIAIYTFFSAGGRRQTVARAAQPDPIEAAIETPTFVPTPDAARDYAAEQPQEPAASDGTQAASPAQTQNPPAPPPTTARSEKAATDSRDLAASARPAAVSLSRTSNSVPSPAVSRTPVLRETPLPRIERGALDARLIRVRSMKIASGVRYDLTFDLQDESGRHAQWERLLISTRSASGISHTQAVPFVHRLGANGALTFTVSVEMRGNSEPDWHGRVVCTTTGADNDGRPVRASFGASVNP